MDAIRHSSAFKTRRFLNWFPLGIAYATLYMGRYNLTVAKTSLESLMTKEDFGVIFGAGTFVYAISFLVNAPIVDRLGGRFGMLIGVAGAAIANLLMGTYLSSVLNSPGATDAPLRLVFSLLYGLNMYFQSYGALSIVKVNASWFHVRERGGFSGIFGTMISSGLFLAFTVNGWLLESSKSFSPGQRMDWVVFAAPGAVLAIMFVVELFLLKDRPSGAGHADFDTGDASSGESEETPRVMELFKRIFTNPIILTIALVEFCTGVLRNGVMQWFPVYAKEVWVLPSDHWLRNGGWTQPSLTYACIAVAILSGILAAKSSGRKRITLVTLSMFAFVAPFFQGGWGGLLFMAGVIGGNVAGWVSDLFFQSRRAPSAGGLYLLLFLCSIGMVFTLSPPSNVVEWVGKGSGLEKSDRILMVAGTDVQSGWPAVARAVACVPAACKDSQWNPQTCMCESTAPLFSGPTSQGKLEIQLEREGQVLSLEIPDPLPAQRAGDKRTLKAGPEMPLTPTWMGILVFLMSLCVIGAHGLLSGTATMDFGGRKAAATAVGIIDGFVYLGTAVQSISLGYLTTRNWSYWPLFLIPFAIVGFLLLLRIWNAKPSQAGASH